MLLVAIRKARRHDTGLHLQVQPTHTPYVERGGWNISRKTELLAHLPNIYPRYVLEKGVSGRVFFFSHVCMYVLIEFVCQAT